MITDNNDEIAIKLENITRGYGANDKVIEHLNLSIKKGTVNCLIGSSGCGKSTILKTILGRLIPDEGRVLVFGREPHDNHGDFPGSSIGYAPQEQSLHYELTIEQTLKYFSEIHCMSEKLYIERRNYLIELLDLPDMSKVIRNCSGGQQRRVSLAVALLHSPKLLILDEPTVGICPLVSANIWRQLSQLSTAEGVTILITTHYLEEARQSDMIFLLRNGKILEKGSPNYLLQKYDCLLLEGVYFKICRDQQEQTVESIDKMDQIEKSETNTTQSGVGEIDLVTIDENHYGNHYNDLEDFSEKNKFLPKTIRKFKQSMALSKRKLTQFLVTKQYILFDLITPSILIVLFYLSIGNVPRGINVGIMNSDTGSMGLEFINNLGNNDTIVNVINYESISNGIHDVKEGDLWGFIEIPLNFTDGMFNRALSPFDAIIPDSELNIIMDPTSYQINIVLKEQIQNAFYKMANDSGIKTIPINSTVSIYGDDMAPKFNWFLAPSIIGVLTFAFCMAFISVEFVREKYDGTQDRLFSYGVSPGSIVFGKLLAHLPILFIQFSVILLITVYGFEVPCNGNILLIYVFLFLLNIISMCQAVLIASIVKSEVEAVQLTLGFFFCTFFIAGIIWPIESMPVWFKGIALSIPSTWSSLALRGLMIKALPFSHPDIWKPFVILVAYLIGVIVLATYSIPTKERNYLKKLSKLYNRLLKK